MHRRRQKRTHREGRYCSEEAATSQGCRHHHEPGEAGRTPRWSPRRELGPGTPGSQTLASRTARGYMSLVLSHRFCGNFLWQPRDMITNGTGRKGHRDSGRARAKSLLVLRLQTSEHRCWFNAPSEVTTDGNYSPAEIRLLTKGLLTKGARTGTNF